MGIKSFQKFITPSAAASKIKAYLLAPASDEPSIRSMSQKHIHTLQHNLRLWCLAGSAALALDFKGGVGI